MPVRKREKPPVNRLDRGGEQSTAQYTASGRPEPYKPLQRAPRDTHGSAAVLPTSTAELLYFQDLARGKSVGTTPSLGAALVLNLFRATITTQIPLAEHLSFGPMVG